MSSCCASAGGWRGEGRPCPGVHAVSQGKGGVVRRSVGRRSRSRSYHQQGDRDAFLQLASVVANNRLVLACLAVTTPLPSHIAPPALPAPRAVPVRRSLTYFLFSLIKPAPPTHTLFTHSQSTIQRTPVMSIVGLVVGLVLSVARGAFGDLFRALGLASVLAVTRIHRLSAEYPFLPYARRALVMLPRRPFPPAENPWKYKRADALAELEEAGVADDGNLPAEFSMAKVGRGGRCDGRIWQRCSGSRAGALGGLCGSVVVFGVSGLEARVSFLRPCSLLLLWLRSSLSCVAEPAASIPPAISLYISTRTTAVPALIALVV